MTRLKMAARETRSVFHLPKNSGNSGWHVNGTRLFGSFHRKFSGENFTMDNLFHLQISRLYHQFY